MSDILFTPSCGQDDGTDCLQPDTNVFFFTSMAGRTGTACAGTGFSPVADQTTPGRFILVPFNNAQVILGPANSATLNARQCVINANFTVLRLPTIDSTVGPGLLTTNSLASATFRGQNTNLTGPAAGGATAPIVGPNLQISKAPAAPGPTINAGQDAQFTITVTNTGTGTANQVSLTDQLPNIAGLTWAVTAQSPALGCSVLAGPPPTLNCPIFDLAAGAVASITLTATTTLTACQQMNNQVTVSAINNNLDLSGPPTPFPPAIPITSNQAQINCNVVMVDLFVSKSNGTTSVNAGGTTTYTITVTNSGPSTVAPTLSDPAVGGLTKTAVACGPQPGQCSSPPSVGTLEAGFALPSLTTGQTYQITVTANVTAQSGTVTNTATVTPPALTVNTGASCVTSDGITRSFNSGTGACSSSDTDDVAAANLFISKSATAVDYTPGDTITYTVVVANNGPSAVNATVTDTKPTQFTSWTWVCNPPATGGATGCAGQASGSSNFTNSGLALPSGSTISYTVTAIVSGSATGSIVNKATATPTGGTPNLGTSCVTDGGITRSFNDPTTGACSSTVTLPQGLGVGGGHFDYDIYYFSTNNKGVTSYTNGKHVHQWDNKWNVTGVNNLNPSDANFRLSIPIPDTTTQFKVLVANQYLNPAAFMAVGPGTTQESVKTYGGLAGPSTDPAAVLAGLQTYTRQTYNPDGTSFRLIMNLPKTAFNSIDWWGAGGDGQPRAGVIPNQTGCVNKVNADGSTDDVGPQGERFNGALTITIVRDTTPSSALELNVAGDPRYGWKVKVGGTPNPFAQYVLAEYTVFWHHPNGKCYNGAGWVPNPPLETETGSPAQRPSGTADPQGSIPPNPTIQP